MNIPVYPVLPSGQIRTGEKNRPYILDWADVTLVPVKRIMFISSKYNERDGLSNWDMSRTISVSAMFGKSRFNGDISLWDTSSIIDFSGLFSKSKFSGISGDIGNWQTGAVKTMHMMFICNPRFTGKYADINKWDVSNVVDMQAMFSKTPFNGNISDWDTKSVINISFMFYGSAFSGVPHSITGWNVKNVQDATSAFERSNLSCSLRSWRLSQNCLRSDIIALTPLMKRVQNKKYYAMPEPGNNTLRSNMRKLIRFILKLC